MFFQTGMTSHLQHSLKWTQLVFVPESQWSGVVNGYPTRQHNYQRWSLLQNLASDPGFSRSQRAGEQKGLLSKVLGMNHLCLLFLEFT